MKGKFREICSRYCNQNGDLLSETPCHKLEQYILMQVRLTELDRGGWNFFSCTVFEDGHFCVSRHLKLRE